MNQQQRMGPPPQRPGQQTAMKKQEPVNKLVEVSQLLDKHKDAIAKALPKHLTPDRLARICLTELRKSEKLQACDAMSFMGAVIQAAQLGLEPGSALGECYLVPYAKECTMQLGYRGMVKLAMQSGSVASVEVRAVYDGDFFEPSLGTESYIIHKPDYSKVNKNAIAFYAVVKTKAGGVQFDIMGRPDMDEHRAEYTNKYSEAWKTSYDEMAKKTVLRRLLKLVPMSPELARAIETEDEDQQENHKIIDADYAVPEQQVNPEKWAEVQNGAQQREEGDRKVAMAMLNSSISHAKTRKVPQAAIDEIFEKRPIPDWELDADIPMIYSAVSRLNELKAPEPPKA